MVNGEWFMGKRRVEGVGFPGKGKGERGRRLGAAACWRPGDFFTTKYTKGKK